MLNNKIINAKIDDSKILLEHPNSNTNLNLSKDFLTLSAKR